MKTKKNWKEDVKKLLNELPKLGINVTKYRKALEKLPIEPFTAETYDKTLTGRNTYSNGGYMSEFRVGFCFTGRDIDAIYFAAKKQKIQKLIDLCDEINPIFDRAIKSFNYFAKKSYPNNLPSYAGIR